MANPNIAIRHSIYGLALFVAALFVFAPALGGPFLFDDILLVDGNHYVHSFEYWTRWFFGTLWDTNYFPGPQGGDLVFWRPLVLASFAWDWSIGHGQPVIFHITNLILHAVNSVLVWILFRGWFRPKGLALGLATLFAIHPVHSEVVCWVSGRGDSLCLMGLLCSALGIRAALQGKRLGVLLALSGAILAFLSKEMAIVLPAVVGLESLAREEKAWRPTRRTWMMIGMASVGVLAYATIRSALFKSSPITDQIATLPSRWPFVLEAFGRGVSLAVWPFDTTLGRAVVRSSRGVLLPRYDYACLGSVALVGTSLAAWLARRSRPAVWAGWLAVLVCWFPVSGVLSHGEAALVSPRYLYIPLLTMLFVVGKVLEPWLAKPRMRRGPFAVWLGASMVLFSVSFLRAQDFSSTEGFWRAELSQNPNYIAAQDYFVGREIRQERPHSALRLALAFLESNRVEKFEQLNAELNFHVLKAATLITKDIQRGSLQKLSLFCDSVAQGRLVALDLPSQSVHLDLGSGAAIAQEWSGKRNRLLLLSAELLSRLGNDKDALIRLDIALKNCEKCWTLLGRGGLVRARAGDLAGAAQIAANFEKYAPARKGENLREILTEAFELGPIVFGPNPPPVLVANYYLSLEAYGRAYAAAKGAFANPPRDPAAHKMLAELAFRAGDVDAARQMLANSMSSAQIQTWETEMLKTVQWSDSAIPPGTWMPPIP